MPRARKRIAPACRKSAEKWMRRWAATRSRWMPENKRRFRALQARIADYWKALDPISHWDAREKLARTDAFMHRELFPRRATTLEIADRIGAVNEQELNNGDERLKVLFDRFRYRLILMLAITLGIGALLAVATIRHILRLARDADLRYAKWPWRRPS
jgi:hypothetical protein